MQIDVLDHVAGAREARGVAVVIDVFRAFSVAAYAFDGGVARLLPAGEIDEALELGRRFPGAACPAHPTRKTWARTLPGSLQARILQQPDRSECPRQTRPRPAPTPLFQPDVSQ